MMCVFWHFLTHKYYSYLTRHKLGFILTLEGPFWLYDLSYSLDKLFPKTL